MQKSTETHLGFTTIDVDPLLVYSFLLVSMSHISFWSFSRLATNFAFLRLSVTEEIAYTCCLWVSEMYNRS